MSYRIVAMPAFNEAHTIADIIIGCKKHVDKVVVVDDGSTDNTLEIAELLGAYVVRHETNKGYGAAIKNCFETARRFGADAMVIIDSDGQHDPSEIPKLLEPLKNGFDVVIGSRFVNGNGRNVPTYRKFGMKVLDIVTCAAGGFNVTDSQSGYRAYGRRAIESINLNYDDMSAGSEILIQARSHKLKFTEVGIYCRYDLHNCSSENPFFHGFKVLVRILKDAVYKRSLSYFTFFGVILWLGWMFIGLEFLQNFYLGGGISFRPMLLMVLPIFSGLSLLFTGIIMNAISKLLFYLKDYS